MEILYLSRADVQRVGVSMKAILEAVDQGLRLKGLQKVELPAKVGLHPRDNCFIHALTAYVQDIEYAGVKWSSGFPSNPQKGLPYINGLIIINYADTGIPKAVMDCAWITSMRTGASAGVAAKYLALPASTSAAFVACGVQARTSLAALVEACAQLKTIYCYDLHEQATQRFIDDMGQTFSQLEFVVCNNAQSCVRDADIVVTSTPIVTEPKPILDAGAIKPGALAVSLDYDAAWSNAAMAECELFASDDIHQLTETVRHGFYFQNLPDLQYTDLGDIAAGLQPGRGSPTQRTFSMNMGIAVHDMMTARLVYEKAQAQNIGTMLPS